MAFSDPRQAVIDHLVAPAGEPTVVSDAGTGAGPVAAIYSGKPYAARLNSIEIRKERGLDDRRLFAVAFADLSGNRWSYLVAAERHDDGWTAHGVAGGSNGPPATERRSRQSTGASIDIYGQWGADRLYVGGELDPGTAVVGEVRLTLADGAQITADGEDGIALFVGHRGAPPSRVEVFDQRGDLLLSQNAL